MRKIEEPRINNYYIYMLVDPKTGEFYIGSRTSTVNHNMKPEDDWYMGSASHEWVDRERLGKKVIMHGIYNWKRSTVLTAESYIIDYYFDHEKNVNKVNPIDRGYCTSGLDIILGRVGHSATGVIPVKDEDGNESLIKPSSQKYKKGELLFLPDNFKNSNAERLRKLYGGPLPITNIEKRENIIKQNKGLINKNLRDLI